MSPFKNLLRSSILVYDSSFGGLTAHPHMTLASSYYGADPSLGEGFKGQAYALPTRDKDNQLMSLSDLHWHIETFLGYGASHPNQMFQVLPIACGEGEYKHEQIAPYFTKAADNVFLPSYWLHLLKKLEHPKLIVQVSDGANLTEVIEQLDQATKAWGKFEVITTCDNDGSDAVQKWARSKKHAWTPFPADTDRFKEKAKIILDNQLTWYGTHMIAFCSPRDAVLKQRILHAQKEHLKVKTIWLPENQEPLTTKTL